MIPDPDSAAAPPDTRRRPPEEEDNSRDSKRFKASEEEKTAKARSEEFLASLKLDEDDGALEPVDGADDVWYLKDVVTIADTSTKNATTQNVVFSKEVMEFWDVCIASAERHHICALELGRAPPFATVFALS